MTAQQLHLFNLLYLVILILVAILSRATARRIAGPWRARQSTE